MDKPHSSGAPACSAWISTWVPPAGSADLRNPNWSRPAVFAPALRDAGCGWSGRRVHPRLPRSPQQPALALNFARSRHRPDGQPSHPVAMTISWRHCPARSPVARRVAPHPVCQSLLLGGVLVGLAGRVTQRHSVCAARKVCAMQSSTGAWTTFFACVPPQVARQGTGPASGWHAQFEGRGWTGRPDHTIHCQHAQWLASSPPGRSRLGLTTGRTGRAGARKALVGFDTRWGAVHPLNQLLRPATWR